MELLPTGIKTSLDSNFYLYTVSNHVPDYKEGRQYLRELSLY